MGRLALALLVLVAAAAGCGGGGGESEDGITIYSGRAEELVGPLFEQFEDDTGIDVAVRYGDSAELAATLAEEGADSPADVFFSQDAGSLGAVAAEGLLTDLPEDVLGAVDDRFRDPDGHWVGTSGRVRVVAYGTERVDESELPGSIWDYTDPSWRGRIGIAPTNASFQATISAMILDQGVERTRAWLDAVRANDPQFYENNIQAVEAIADGEIDIAFVNHYYLYEILRERPDAPVANHFLTPGDDGALVNVSGAGVLASTNKPARAEAFVEYLLGDGQRFYADESAEYPLVDGIEPDEQLPALSDLHGPDVALGALGGQLEETLQLLNETGFTL